MPRKEMVGRVVSTKMQKTAVVEVFRTKQHPLYKKTMRSSEKYFAHDEEQVCKEGDLVRIVEARPLSRRKRWSVVEVMQAGGDMVTAEEVAQAAATE
jgi:small subunit ribosomal protein S17